MKAWRGGQSVTLTKELARSGQGTVYFTDDPRVLAKVYTSNQDPERYDKIKVMVEYVPEDPTWQAQQHISIAWPRDMLLDDKGTSIGFLMPYIENALELTHVYNPAFRARHAPRFNWFYLHNTALNYASAVAAVHAKGYVIGDIKPQNVLVNRRALISLIDTDSFQVISPRSGLRFRCPVGTEGFTPRELLLRLGGAKFSEADRSEMHDRFGMAVIIYLLLFGRHPFMEGRWKGPGDPPPPDERVLRGLWLHVPGGEISRDRGTIPLEIIHPALQQCMRRCFIEGHHEPSLRPSAMEWRNALKTAIAELISCPKQANHYYSRHTLTCFWCQRRELLGLDIFSPELHAPK
jgi:DNA-binding helix-hairpin-helix protein with protein kinase domain